MELYRKSEKEGDNVYYEPLPLECIPVIIKKGIELKEGDKIWVDSYIMPCDKTDFAKLDEIRIYGEKNELVRLILRYDNVPFPLDYSVAIFNKENFIVKYE